MEKRDIERCVYVVAFMLYGLYGLYGDAMDIHTLDLNTVYVFYGVVGVLGILTLLRHQSATVLFGLYMFYTGVVELYSFLTLLLFSGTYRRELPFGDMAILCIAGIFCFVGGGRLILFALKNTRGLDSADSPSTEETAPRWEWIAYCAGVPFAVLFYILLIKDGVKILSEPDIFGMRTLYILTVFVPSLYLLVAGAVSFFVRRFSVILYGGYLIGLGSAFLLASRIVPRAMGHLPRNSDAVQIAVVGLIGLLIGLRLVHLGLKENRLTPAPAAGVYA